METINFDYLVGQTASLYQCNDVNCFQLGSVIFEAIEDENDSYRSMMDGVRVVRRDAMALRN